MKCRSDPHVVVNFTATMTSLGLRMVGSSTFSTDRSLTPFHTSALMAFPFSAVRRAGAWVVSDGGYLAGQQKRAGPVQGLERQCARQCAGCRTADSSDHFGAALLRRVAHVEDDLSTSVGIDADVAHPALVLDHYDTLPVGTFGVVEDELPPKMVRADAAHFGHVAEYLGKSVTVLKKLDDFVPWPGDGDRLNARVGRHRVRHLLGYSFDGVLDLPLRRIYQV